jgi:hypothetical protein
MEHNYRQHRIIAEAERDPDNMLFRALIFISTLREGVSVTIKERQPTQGTFSSSDEAELHALTWAMAWVDRKIAKDEGLYD